jgi:hypothetical protein
MSQAVLEAPPRAVPQLAPAGYIQRPLPIAIILSAFFVFTLPLAYLASAHPDSPGFLKL